MNLQIGVESFVKLDLGECKKMTTLGYYTPFMLILGILSKDHIERRNSYWSYGI